MELMENKNEPIKNLFPKSTNIKEVEKALDDLKKRILDLVENENYDLQISLSKGITRDFDMHSGITESKPNKNQLIIIGACPKFFKDTMKKRFFKLENIFQRNAND